MTSPLPKQNTNVAHAETASGQADVTSTSHAMRVRTSILEQWQIDVFEPWPSDNLVRKVREICDQRYQGQRHSTIRHVH